MKATPFGGCCLLTLAGVAVMALMACQPPEAKETHKETLRSVRIDEVVSADLPVKVQAVGRLVPNREVSVSAQVGGIVKAYNADVGDKVRVGQWLVKIDTRDFILSRNQAQAALLSAQAGLAVAKSSYKRSKGLLPDKAITLEAYDRAEAEYKSAQASETQLKATLDIARRTIEKATIEAPFDGYITHRSVETGQNIHPDQVLMAVADMQTMRVRIFLNEQDYVRLDKDDWVGVKVEAFSNREFEGVIDKIGIKADARTNTFQVEILVNNADNLLKAGLTARVELSIDVIEDAIMIPQNTVLFRENRREVFIVEDNDRAVARQVILGRSDGALVQIEQGLTSGDRLVVSGAQYLKEGDKVIIVP